MDGHIDALIGATIKRATFDKSDGCLYFDTDRGVFRGEPIGDCCACCYVQHVSGADALASGAVVTSTEDLDLPPVPDDEVSGTVTDNWGHRITTTKGTCSIEMRVDHNGYYGGSLHLCIYDGDPEGGTLDDF